MYLEETRQLISPTTVSDPAHARYGQHLSQAEVNDFVKPADETLIWVHEWLSENGIEESQLDYSPAKDWIKITLPVASVERLLDTKYSVFQHEDGEHLVRTPQWYVRVVNQQKLHHC